MMKSFPTATAEPEAKLPGIFSGHLPMRLALWEGQPGVIQAERWKEAQKRGRKRGFCKEAKS